MLFFSEKDTSLPRMSHGWDGFVGGVVVGVVVGGPGRDLRGFVGLYTKDDVLVGTASRLLAQEQP